MPSFGKDVNSSDVQSYLMFMMNFYEMHMNNFKGIIMKQNETISSQKNKINENDKTAQSLQNKLEGLERTFRGRFILKISDFRTRRGIPD